MCVVTEDESALIRQYTEDCKQDLNAIGLHPTRLEVRASKGATYSHQPASLAAVAMWEDYARFCETTPGLQDGL
jgi:hypothetical protein